jgi:hypothetical protein
VHNQRVFLDALGKKIGIKKEDWHYITVKELCVHGGAGLLYKYRNSKLKMLQSVYPTEEWVPWKFHHASNGFWENENNIRSFLDWLGKILHLKNLDDWYRIGRYQIQHYTRTTIIRSNRPSLLKALRLRNVQGKQIPYELIVHQLLQLFPGQGKLSTHNY